MFYSTALSVKMNVLLFAPGIALLYYQGIGIFRSAENAILFIGVQVLVGYPFLIENPYTYMSKAFEFSRQFLYKWSVNWKMVPEDLFLHQSFSRALLGAHLFFLMIFLIKWTRYSLILI